MAHEVNVSDNIAITESPAVYGVGGGDSVTSAQLMVNEPPVDDTHDAYFINAFLGAATGVKTLYDAPGSGKHIAIKKLTATCADKNSIRIGEGESGGWVEKVIWGPLIFNTEVTAAAYKVGNQYEFKPFKPLRLTANKALTADNNSAGLVLITGEIIVN
jgi:hypothetical protein